MNITFTGPNGLKPVDHWLQITTAATPTVGLAQRIGVNQINAISARSFAGIDVSGAPYAPYSPAYAKRKLKRGGNGIVNLFSTNTGDHMLDALQVEANGQRSGFTVYQDSSQPLMSSIGIGIYDQPELETRLRVHNEGTSRIPKREVLGVSPTDLHAMAIDAINYLDSKIVRLI